jgi:hypothetical protein
MWTIPPVVVSLAVFAVPIAYVMCKAYADAQPRLRTVAAGGTGARLPDARPTASRRA